MMSNEGRKAWFYRYSPRNGGDLAGFSEETHNAILDLWVRHLSKAQIATQLNISVGLVRKAVRMARLAQDPRGFAKVQPLINTYGHFTGILDMYQQHMLIKGLSERLGVHFTKIEQAIRETAKQIREKADGN